MSRHTESPDFDRMAEARQIIHEVKQQDAEIARLRREKAMLVEALERINRTTYPGTRTLDDFIRDMGWACDEARRALSSVTEKGEPA